MKNIKKIKFRDIQGMLERDEMREIIGGSGSPTGSGSNIYGGGGTPALNGGAGFGSSFTGSNYGGFGGNNAIGGGVYAGLPNPTGAGESSYPGSPYYNGGNSGSGSSSSSGNSSTAANNYSNNGGWVNHPDGSRSTNNLAAISRYYDFLYANNGAVDKNQISNFINKESNSAGRDLNNIDLYGTVQLNNVNVINNYKGPSTIPQGIIYDGQTLIFKYNYNGSSGSKNITPTPEFLSSPFGSVYNKLTSENTNFLCLVDKFNNSKKFNLNYIYSNILDNKDNLDAITGGSLIVSGKVIKGANIIQQFDPSKIYFVKTTNNTTRTYERSEIGKVTDVIHEALHANLMVNNIANGADHAAFNEYRNMLINTLSEYNTDNKLGFTFSQINEMAYKGTTGSNGVSVSPQFASYIQGLATSNNTSYATELNNYDKRLSDLNWNLISTVTKY